ncbi:MAG: hypothetical protein LKF42_09130 [Streptococcaceae bacterium]|nr:hypothetical protein [Streptococcaceae bacterium]
MTQNEIFEVEEIKESKYAESKFKINRPNMVILLLILLLASLAMNITQVVNQIGLSKFVNIVFINNDEKLEWAGITSVVAIISLVSTIIITVRKNRQDLVSKSRIEWLQVNKKIMAQYLKDVNYYPYFFQKIKILLEENNTLTFEIELEDLQKKIQENHYLLLMNLSDNPDNKQINTCITDCVKWINNMETRYNLQKNHFKYTNEPVTNLLKVSRDYYKREWDKAKQGK